MRRFLSLLIALLGLITSLYLVRAWTDTPPPAVSAPDPDELERRIEAFEDRVASPEPDPLNLSVLGQLYLLRAGTGYGLEDYELAQQALAQAAETLSDGTTLNALANSHLALHEFSEARQVAARSLEVERSDATLASMADAEMALGAYQSTSEILAELATRNPDEPAFLVRQAQLSFLTGDVEKALATSERAAANAAAAGLSTSEQTFYLTVAGRMHFEAGRYVQAEPFLARALSLDDRDPGVLFEKGRVRAARGDFTEAIDLLEQAVALVPDPAALALLGDLYLAEGRVDLSNRQYQTIGVIQALDQSAYRLPVAAAYAGRGLHQKQALSLAAEELTSRADPTTWHIYGLALYRDGRVEQAYGSLPHMLGPADARIWYHAGLIAAAHGEEGEARAYLERALELNPHFHPVDAHQARQVLEGLLP